MTDPNLRTPRTANEWHPSRMDAIEHYRSGDRGAWVMLVVVVAALTLAMAVHFVVRLA